MIRVHKNGSRGDPTFYMSIQSSLQARMSSKSTTVNATKYLQNQKKMIAYYQIKTEGNCVTYLMPHSVLLGLDVRPWSYQRPIDDARVSEISSGIKEEKDVHGIIAMAWHPEENLVVYDGQHRWKALESITPGSVEDEEIKVFVEIAWDATQDEITRRFQRVNNCVAVSELYKQGASADEQLAADRDEISTWMAAFCKKHREFVSTNGKPKRPQFNRDTFTDEIYSIACDRKLKIGTLLEAITSLNEDYIADVRMRPTDKAMGGSKTIKEKCEKHGLWLFAETGRLNLDHVMAKLA